jgi:hypothetical protein
MRFAVPTYEFLLLQPYLYCGTANEVVTVRMRKASQQTTTAWSIRKIGVSAR